jgi:hypothetical protein
MPVAFKVEAGTGSSFRTCDGPGVEMSALQEVDLEINPLAQAPNLAVIA